MAASLPEQSVPASHAANSSWHASSAHDKRYVAVVEVVVAVVAVWVVLVLDVAVVAVTVVVEAAVAVDVAVVVVSAMFTDVVVVAVGGMDLHSHASQLLVLVVGAAVLVTPDGGVGVVLSVKPQSPEPSETQPLHKTSSLDCHDRLALITMERHIQPSKLTGVR